MREPSITQGAQGWNYRSHSDHRPFWTAQLSLPSLLPALQVFGAPVCAWALCSGCCAALSGNSRLLWVPVLIGSAPRWERRVTDSAVKTSLPPLNDKQCPLLQQRRLGSAVLPTSWTATWPSSLGCWYHSNYCLPYL